MQTLKLLLPPITGVLMLLSLYLIYLWVPSDQNLGVSQRIFYFHVPLAILSLVPPPLVFLTSIAYLWRQNTMWDSMARSAVEIGALFTTLTLITGSIWARPTWGVWWAWDPMLTTFFILWLIYMSYLLLRSYTPTGDQGARYAAILGIVGSVNALIVYFATELWRTQHPDKVIGPAADSGSLDPQMALGLLASFLTIGLIFVYLFLERFSLHRDESHVELLWEDLDNLS